MEVSSQINTSAALPLPPPPQGKLSPYTLAKRLGGFQSRSGRFGFVGLCRECILSGKYRLKFLLRSYICSCVAPELKLLNGSTVTLLCYI
jgi:hypothetical protein